jgi:hypothetical protein
MEVKMDVFENLELYGVGSCIQAVGHSGTDAESTEKPRQSRARIWLRALLRQLHWSGA